MGLAGSICMAMNMGMAGDLRPERFGEVEMLGAPLTNISIQHCVVGSENGEPMAYYTVAGKPAIFHVLSLNENRVVGKYELRHASRAWTHTIAPDGTVYIGGVALGGKSAHFYRYLPGEKRVEDLGPGVADHSFIWALTAADDGRIYGGTWEGGHVFEYNPETGKNRDLGRVDPTEDYVRSIAWHGGQVYAGTGTRNGRIWRLDPETGEKERIEIPQREEYAEHFDRVGSIYHLAVAGDHLVAFLSGPRVLLIYDMVNRKWWDRTIPFGGGPVSGVYSETEDVFYYPGRDDNQLHGIDMKTREDTTVMRYRGGFRGGGFVKINGMPGMTLATVFGSGAVGLLNPESRIGKTLKSQAEGQPTYLHSLRKGPGGDLFVSGYMGATGGAYDIKTGKTRSFKIGQSEGIVQFGDELFYGVYPGARIYRQAPLSKDIAPKLIEEVGHRQDRPFAMIASEDKVFIGTIPDYGELGGALMVFTKKPDGELESVVYPKVVEEQSIVGLAYHEPSGLLFGSTSIFGGLGVEPSATAAKMFVWDVAAGKKLEEFSLNLPGVDSPRMIGGLSVGPDGNIWGTVNGHVFVLDPKTRKVVTQKNIYPDVSNYGKWRPVYLEWGQDGLLYLNLVGRLTVVDPQTLNHLQLPAQSGLLTLGDDGNIYFANGPELKRIPVMEKR